LRGEAIEVRRADQTVAVGADAVIAKLVRDDQDDVGFVGAWLRG